MGETADGPGRMSATDASETTAEEHAIAPKREPRGVEALAVTPSSTRQAPGPGRDVALRNTRRFLRDPLGFLLGLTRQYGDVVRCQFVVGNTYIINHPDDVRRVLQENVHNYTKDSFDYTVMRRLVGETLLTSDGATWRRQRRLIQPAFHHQRIVAFGDLMLASTTELLTRWDERVERQAATPFDITGEMEQLTLTIVGKALFGVNLGDGASGIAQGIHAMTAYTADLFYHPYVPLLGPLSGKNRDLRRRRRQMEATLDALIQQRRQAGQPPQTDVLSLLMTARNDTGERFDDVELRNEMSIFLAAGNENTAAALSWVWYLLALHPAVEARLHGELAEVLDGREPTVEDIRQLPYLSQVIDETMRLYPPAWFFARKAQRDDTLGGYHIPAGAEVWICPYTTHHHATLWEQPETFDPERFSPERSAGRLRMAYFPFSAGAHMCIGYEFALMEIRLLFALMAQHYRLRLAPGETAIPEALIALRPKHPLRMIAERRM